MGVSRVATTRERNGFVLAFVVFMLFAISVAAATGYMLVESEFSLARHSSDGSEALAVARAGLERYVAESLGTLSDTSSYALGAGIAVVTPRKLFEQDSVTHVYYIRSEGTVDDIRLPGTPARRVVGAYATYHRRPLPHRAVVVLGADAIEVLSAGGGEVLGVDDNVVADCAGGGASTITGVVGKISVTEDVSTAIQGSPDSYIWPGGWDEVRDSLVVRWDVLTDPDFPVEFENTLPNFASLPADSFPVIRYTGHILPAWSGRGVLIVDGRFDPSPGFQWDGIVMAKHVDDYIHGDINGMLIAALDAPNMYSTVQIRTDVNYHSCYVYAANESLAYLELMSNTIHETN